MSKRRRVSLKTKLHESVGLGQYLGVDIDVEKMQ